MRLLWVIFFLPALLNAAEVTPAIPSEVAERPFISGDLWANPLEDWQLTEGTACNTFSGGNRNLVSLTSELLEEGDWIIATDVSVQSKPLKGRGERAGFIGFQIGLQGSEGPQGDYREAAVYGIGLSAGVTSEGQLFVGSSTSDSASFPAEKLTRLVLKRTGPELTLTATAQMADGTVTEASHSLKVHPSWLKGLAALTASANLPPKYDFKKPRPQAAVAGIHFGRSRTESEAKKLQPMRQGRGGDIRAAFSNFTLSGPGVAHHPDRTFGPIWWTTHTLTNDGQLTFLVQMAPVTGYVRLNLNGEELRQAISPISHTARFSTTLTHPDRDTYFSVKFGDKIETGKIPALPKADQKVTVASLSCNDSTGFPHARLEANVASHQPDFITFHGDQIYEGIGGYGYIVDQAPNRRAEICYLRKYALHGWTWKNLLNTRPSITIPDDHDVMHGNIWGEGGKLTNDVKNTFDNQDSGGYKMSPRFVNMVHRTQVANLPLPDDQPKAKNGITTYFTDFRYGPLDFAVLSDRMFKSAPKTLLPDAEINNGWPQNLEWNPKTDADHPDAQLLGTTQEAFLSEWAEKQAPEGENPFRILISQSPFLAPQTLPEEMHHDKDVPRLPKYKKGEYAPNDEPKPDFDTNGWPQKKQRVALELLKKADALHIVGDQHLGTTGIYGIDDYADGTWWIATPAIANVWPRRWMPKVQAAKGTQKPGWPRYLGGFEDGFGNKFTLHAVANPWDVPEEPARLFDRAVGYAITTFDRPSNTISLANYPYLHSAEKSPYPGWPITITKK